MTITLNGAPYELAGTTTIAELIERVTGASRGSAAVVAGEIVPRSQWSTTTLAEGAQVEIVTATQGG
ncbi:sulfur carrier protein ThiS [Jatrophihabitans fulvus]